MEKLDSLEDKLKRMIIEVLVLEDLTPEDIKRSEPLFVDGLGLDSIDALELAMSLEEEFEITVGEDPEETQQVFANIASLARFVAENRRK
jgi:acyl carrier protein